VGGGLGMFSKTWITLSYCEDETGTYGSSQANSNGGEVRSQATVLLLHPSTGESQYTKEVR